MSKDYEEKLSELNEEKLADDELKDVSGGQIELAADEPTGLAGGTTASNGLSKGDYIA